MKKLIVVLSLLFIPLIARASFDGNLYYGLQNNNGVKELQEFLTGERVYSGPVTGNFFSLTLKAVKDFQKKEGITPVSGFFGPLTRQKANEILGRIIESSNQKEAATIPSEPTKNTDNIVKSLQDQIALLLRQLNLLQFQNSIVQKQNETINKIQEDTQQIVQNTTPSTPATPVPEPNPRLLPPYDPSIFFNNSYVVATVDGLSITFQLNGDYFNKWNEIKVIFNGETVLTKAGVLHPELGENQVRSWVKIDNLSPGTQYSYSVIYSESGREDTIIDKVFKTAQ